MKWNGLYAHSTNKVSFMISFPNAKINLGLRILSKRQDGYHNLESCLYPIPWHDVLEIIPAKRFAFTSSGLLIPGDPGSNLCVKAYGILHQQFGIAPVRIHLHKAIPTGAGLGGGSADGAFVIKMLNEIFGLNMQQGEMERLASELGSDCPFFIRNQPVLASGTGTELQPADLSLKGKYLAVIHPQIHVSTREAYSLVQPHQPEGPLLSILQRPLHEWRGILENDFEPSVFSRYPPIGKVKDELYAAGAAYAAMSGSGSAVFGIFEKRPELRQDWRVFGL